MLLREARAEFFCTAPDPNATSGEHISAATLKHMTNLDHLSKQEMYWLLGIVMSVVTPPLQSQFPYTSVLFRGWPA